jgi:adenylate cyclase
MDAKLARRLDQSMRWLVPLAVLVAITGVRVSGWGWVEAIQHRAFDAYLNIAPRPYTDAKVRVIDIDEKSLTDIGQWPWPRTDIALLVRRLTERGAKVIAFDSLFPEPDQTSPKRIATKWPDGPGMKEIKTRVSSLPDHDEALARELKKSSVVLSFAPIGEDRAHLPAHKATIGFLGSTTKTVDAQGNLVVSESDDPTKYLTDYPGAVSNLPILDSAATGMGSMGFAPEHDGIIRRAPLLFRFGEQLYPSLALESVRVSEHTSGIRGKLAATNRDSWLHRLIDDATGITVLKVGQYLVPTDGAGRIWVYYTAESVQRTLPAWKIMDPKAVVEGMKDTIVFIGTSAQGLKDLRATPLNAAEAGVQVHANIAEQIILQQFLDRPGRASRLEVAATVAGGLLLLVLLVQVGAAWAAPVGIAMIAAALGISWHAYTAWHWLVDPVYPVTALASVFASFAAVGYVSSERDRRKITDTFGRYLSPKVVENLAKHPGTVELGGETREMTFHFCDIRGFTTISEKFDPHGLTDFINRFLTPMTEIILAHDGTIDKYMGDCIMAFWNAPMTVPEHARKACTAALAMHARLAELNAKWQAEAKAAGRDLPEIHIGTGLNTGPCVVGNMGSTLRVDYTVLGDDVNLASRLEGQSKSYGVNIVIGPTTREQAADFATLELDLIKVKGKTVPVHIFVLLGGPDDAKSAAFQELRKTHEAMLAAYRAQDWDGTVHLLAQCRERAAGRHLDKLYALYDERVAVFRAEPPGADWDGVFTATSK